jgi:hypothetical protein
VECSNARFSVLFEERDGTKAAAQIRAFEATWRWDAAANRAYQEVVQHGGPVSIRLECLDLVKVRCHFHSSANQDRGQIPGSCKCRLSAQIIGLALQRQ